LGPRVRPVASNNDISGSNKQSRVTFNAVPGATYFIGIDGAGAAKGNYLLNWAQAAEGANTFAAVLPYARSVTTGVTATAFGAMINAGGATATGCSPALPPGFPGTFSYQATNAANQLTGSPDTPVDIAAGGLQNFVFAITPSRDLDAAEMAVVFDCANMPVTVSVPGLNTLLLSASATPSPDVIAIGATPTGDGILDIPGNTGTGFFTAAGVNIGAPGAMIASIDDGGKGLALVATLCQSNPFTAACTNPPTPASAVSLSLATNQTATFTIFVTGTGNVPFDPANNRLFLRIQTADGVTRGATSVAVRTQ
jgi:hypothetical protein